MNTFGGLEMGIFSRKNKENSDVTESRRKFLKKSGAAIGGLAAGLSVPGLALARSGDREVRPGQGPYPWPERFIRSFRERKVPNGAIYSGDPAIPQIWTFLGNRESYGAMRLSTLTSYVTVHRETPYFEPIYYLMAQKLGEEPTNHRQIDGDRLSRDNPALAYFSDGIRNYFNRWEPRASRKYWHEVENNVEDYFMKSLVVAAQRPVSDAEAYGSLNAEERERFLTGITNSLKDVDYNSQLVAAWSSFMLVNHHWVKSDKKGDSDSLEMRRIHNIVEEPLENLYQDKRLALASGENKYLNNSV